MAKIGLDQLHYAVMDEGTDGIEGTAPTYGTPVPIKNVTSINVSSNTSDSTLYADNGPAANATSNGPKTVSINTKDLTPVEMEALLGQTVNSEGVLIENQKDNAPYVAIGFRSLKENGNHRFVWLYKGRFRVPDDNNETKGESVNFQTPTIEATFIRREFDGNVKATGDEDSETFTGGSTWFNAVYEETP